MEASFLVIKQSTKKRQGGEYWYTSPGSDRLTQEDKVNFIRAGIELKFTNASEDRELLDLINYRDMGESYIRFVDKNMKGDTDFLVRIIRNGGFIAYAKKLENKLQELPKNKIYPLRSDLQKIYDRSKGVQSRSKLY